VAAPDSVVPDLKKNKLLAGLTQQEVDSVSLSFEPVAFAEGAQMLRESEPADRVYLLAEGRAEVRKRLSPEDATGVAIATLEAGDFFGEMSFFAGTAERSASVVALSPTRAYSLHRDNFVRLLSTQPAITRNIMANLVSQLQATNQRLLESLGNERRELSAQIADRTRELEKLSLRISRELSVAQSIQRNLLPERRISFPRVTIRTDYLPCDELSGDITGAFSIDDWHIGIYGGDVCGHGIHAAMVMSYVKKLISSSVKRMLLNRQYVTTPPGAVLTSVNESFFAEISLGDPEIYLTLFFGVLDIRDLSLEYSSAGIHVPPLRVSGGAVTELFVTSDHPIGHVRGHQYETVKTTLCPGDALLFASDGVVEARRGRSLFGMERLKAETARIMAGPGEPDPAEISGAVKTYLSGAKPEDDMCLLLMMVE
jgi:phosphoserine phosphatase RsbU/P